LVSDEIVVISRSARDTEAATVQWRGSADGTYAVRTIDSDMEPGTQIYRRAKPSHREWLEEARVRDLALRYGRYLRHTIQFISGNACETLNETPVWNLDTHDNFERDKLAKLFDDRNGNDHFGRRLVKVHGYVGI
jgi:molecular chaperone HtpG